MFTTPRTGSSPSVQPDAGRTSQPTPKSDTVRIEHAGTTLVVRFAGLPAEEDVLAYQKRRRALVDQSRCGAVSFDLADVPTVRSSLVALMLVIRRSGVSVEVLSPTPHVRECLRVMHLDQLLTIRGEGTGDLAD